MKSFYEMMNVGKCKYVVNFHDGEKKHSDGSDFYDLCTFTNERKKQAFVKALLAAGYRPESTRVEHRSPSEIVS